MGHLWHTILLEAPWPSLVMRRFHSSAYPYSKISWSWSRFSIPLDCGFFRGKWKGVMTFLRPLPALILRDYAILSHLQWDYSLSIPLDNVPRVNTLRKMHWSFHYVVTVWEKHSVVKLRLSKVVPWTINRSYTWETLSQTKWTKPLFCSTVQSFFCLCTHCDPKIWGFQNGVFFRVIWVKIPFFCIKILPLWETMFLAVLNLSTT